MQNPLIAGSLRGLGVGVVVGGLVGLVESRNAFAAIENEPSFGQTALLIASMLLANGFMFGMCGAALGMFWVQLRLARNPPGAGRFSAATFGNMPRLLIRAEQLFKIGQWEQAIRPLNDELERDPHQPGSGDALSFISASCYRRGTPHQGEIASLLTYRLRETLINPELLFDALVNLVNFNLTLKSYSEAYHYGQLALPMRPDDSDLLANMVAAAGLSGRSAEAAELFERLKQQSPEKAAHMATIMSPEDDRLASGSDHDCSAIADGLRSALETQARLRLQPPSSQMSSQASLLRQSIAELLTKLESYPVGVRSDEAWSLHAETNAARLPNLRAEYLKLQTLAAVVASSGKAINAAAIHGNQVPEQLKTHRAQALRELNLPEILNSA